MKRVAYLLCELKARDLDSRALIAAHLLKSSIAVVVGQRWAIGENRITSPKGCFLFPTANQIQGAGMAQVREAGHIVIASDEEALPLVDPLINVADNAVANCHRFLVDTDAHMSLLAARYASVVGKFTVTGSPRLEALRAAKIEPIGGAPYVLFNTSFALVNSVWGDLKTALTTFLSGSEFSEEDARLWLEAERAAFETIIPVVRRISAQHRVVIRPHPAERAQTWRDAFPQVEIVEGSPSLTWIKGAMAMVHANSTTGLEAALMGVPAVNLNPISAYGDRYVLKRVNHTVGTAQEAIKTLETFLRDQTGLSASTSMASLFPAHGAKNSAQALAGALDDAPPLSGPLPWTRFAQRTDIQRSKFTVSLQEIKASLERAMAIAGAMPCHIHELDDSVFLLMP